MMKKVLVTGVAGFVGSNLSQSLLAKGYHIIGIDNFSQGEKRNLTSLVKESRFEFHEGDVCDPLFIEKVGRAADFIVHLAAFKIPRYGGTLNTLTINTEGTKNILELSRKTQAKVVFSSTSDVYGKNPNIPFSEDSSCVVGSPTVRRWAYAVSKMFDEQLCFAYAEEFKIPVSIVRYFGGYGPNQKLSWWGGPQSVFIDCALQGKSLTIHGDGLQTRSFIYVSDLVAGTIMTMESDRSLGQVYNIGNPEEISILDLAKMIWKMVRSDDPVIEFIPYQSFSKNYEDVPRRVPNIQKSKDELGFEPKISLKDGLLQTVEWQRKVTRKIT